MLRIPFSVALAAVAVTSFAGFAHGANFVVTPPFKISQAIASALASPDANDVIFVNPGLYDETVTVDFTGTGQESLYFAHNTNTRPIIVGGVKVQDATLVTFDGFEIRSNKADSVAGAVVRDSYAVAFVQSVFPSGDFGGVDADNSNEVIVNACTFGGMDQNAQNDGGFAVKITGRVAHKVTNSTFSGDEGRSIWIEADRSEITNSTVSSNGGDAAVFVSGLVNLVKGVTIKNGDGDGLRVGGVCEINDCDIENNGNVGIRMGLSDSSTWTGGSIKKCTVKDNDSNGILIGDDQAGLDVRSNTIVHNVGCGVRVKSDGNSIRDNTIQKTSAGSQGGNGVLVDSSANHTTIRSNKFSGNSGNGVVIQGDDAYVFLNTATDGDGYINSGSQNTGRDNKTLGQNDF